MQAAQEVFQIHSDLLALPGLILASLGDRRLARLTPGPPDRTAASGPPAH